LVLFFLKKEPKTVALRGFKSLDTTVFCEAEPTLLLLFWKRRTLSTIWFGFVLFKKRTKNSGSARLQIVGYNSLLRSRTNAFASFLEKKNAVNHMIWF
jgi:hypothetical protein